MRSRPPRAFGGCGECMAVSDCGKILSHPLGEAPAPPLLSESTSSAYIQKMGLNFLLLTSAATLLKIIQSSFSAATVGLHLRTDAASAMELSARRRLD